MYNSFSDDWDDFAEAEGSGRLVLCLPSGARPAGWSQSWSSRSSLWTRLPGCQETQDRFSRTQLISYCSQRRKLLNWHCGENSSQRRHLKQGDPENVWFPTMPHTLWIGTLPPLSHMSFMDCAYEIFAWTRVAPHWVNPPGFASLSLAACLGFQTNQGNLAILEQLAVEPRRCSGTGTKRTSSQLTLIPITTCLLDP